MLNLSKGQKIKLTSICPSLNIKLIFSFQPPADNVVDISCLGVDENDYLSDDRYFVFYNQTASPENAILMKDNIFEVYISQLPPQIKKLIFAATIDGNAVMSELGNCQITFKENNTSIASYEFSGHDFQDEKAIILTELYICLLYTSRCV